MSRNKYRLYMDNIGGSPVKRRKVIQDDVFNRTQQNEVLCVNNRREKSQKGRAKVIQKSGCRPKLGRKVTRKKNIKKSSKGAVTLFPPVIKSENDSKEYRTIRLKNGLTALLISDMGPLEADYAKDLPKLCDEINVCACGAKRPAAERDREPERDVSDSSSTGETLSAAGLCIGVGSFEDPPEVPGLAHYLEHMVFMGSAKYPDENDFDVFIKAAGGSSNANTDCEHRKSLKASLDRFAQFFINPLLKQESCERELKAIDNEFDMSKTSDRFKKEQLLASLALPGHPMGNFMWGSKQTIKETPEKNGIDVHATLKEFHRRHYTAQFMTLAVQGKEKLDTLQNWVTEIFSQIPNNNLPLPTYDKIPGPFDPRRFYRLYRAVPVKDIHLIEMIWPLPSLQRYYRTKPLMYLGWLIGHEGTGSILSYLKRRLWAMTLQGGNSETGFEHNSSVSFFSIKIALTDEGMDHYFEVLTAVFQYIKLLKINGPQPQIFEEIKTIEQNSFRWQEQIDAIENVETLCVNMQHYEPEDYTRGDVIVSEYDEEIIKFCLNSLQPDGCYILLYSKRFEEEGICDQVEPWYNTPYTDSEIPADWIQYWETLEVCPDFHLPSENEYIASDFTLKESDCKDTDFPVVITESPISRLWFKKDIKFKIPKAAAHFSMASPLVSLDATHTALFELFLECLVHNLVEVAYSADAAMLTYSLGTKETGLSVKVGGFNDKLRRLFETVVDHIAGFDIGEETFYAIKESLAKTYHNQMLEPDRVARELRLTVIMKDYHGVVEKHAALLMCTRDMLLSFVADFLGDIFVEGLVQGNITSCEASSMEEYLLARIGSSERKKPVSPPEMQIYSIPQGKSHYCRIQNFNFGDKNSVITNYYQYGPASIKDHVLNELLVMSMSEPCFNILRTREQLGYNVYCNNKNNYGVVGFCINVFSQADKFNMDQLDTYIENFLIEYEGILFRMSEDQFQALVGSAIVVKSSEDAHLGEEVERHWSEIVHETWLFDRLDREIRELQKLSLEKLQKWFKYIVPSGHSHKKLSIQVVGHDGPKDGYAKQSPLQGKKRPCQDSGHPKHFDSVAKWDEPQHFTFLPLPPKMKKNEIKDVREFHRHCKIYPPSKIM